MPLLPRETWSETNWSVSQGTGVELSDASAHYEQEAAATRVKHVLRRSHPFSRRSATLRPVQSVWAHTAVLRMQHCSLQQARHELTYNALNQTLEVC
jgi:hypothetical protein